MCAPLGQQISTDQANGLFREEQYTEFRVISRDRLALPIGAQLCVACSRHRRHRSRQARGVCKMDSSNIALATVAQPSRDPVDGQMDALHHALVRVSTTIAP